MNSRRGPVPSPTGTAIVLVACAGVSPYEHADELTAMVPAAFDNGGAGYGHRGDKAVVRRFMNKVIGNFDVADECLRRTT
jgi:hypothetical protein